MPSGAKNDLFFLSSFARKLCSSFSVLLNESKSRPHRNFHVSFLAAQLLRQFFSGHWRQTCSWRISSKWPVGFIWSQRRRRSLGDCCFRLRNKKKKVFGETLDFLNCPWNIYFLQGQFKYICKITLYLCFRVILDSQCSTTEDNRFWQNFYFENFGVFKFQKPAAPFDCFKNKLDCRLNRWLLNQLHCFYILVF